MRSLQFTIFNNYIMTGFSHCFLLPFGELFISQRNDGFDSRYKFTAKELDNETSYTYFGARYYDSDVSVWLSVDPMSDERSWLSPYNYCQWNPLGRVDPSGALDDNFSVDKQGNVKLEENTKDNFDMLYTKSDWDVGNKDNGLKVNDRSILPNLSTTNAEGISISQGHTTGSIDDVFKVFKFCADNTNVEWGLARYQFNKYAVYTSHNTEEVISPISLNIGNIIANIHSHPSVAANYEDEMYSMGAQYIDHSAFNGNKGWSYTPQSRSDWRTKNTHSANSYPSYVYMANSNNLYSINKGSIPSLIKQVHTFNHLYFGVLNHK